MTRKTIRIIEIALGAVLVLFIIILFVFVKPQTRKLNSSSSAVSSTVTSIDSTSSELESAASSKAVSSKVSSNSAASTKPTTGSVASKALTTSAANTSSESAVKETVNVTIYEGDSLVQICKRLESKGVGKFDTLFNTANTYNYNYYSCIANSSKANRCYPLEGYLFPSTYTFYKNDKPADVFGKMLRAFESNTAAYKNQAVASCGSLDKAIILASVIEKEAGNENEVSKVSSVLHNRLKAGWKLNCDATISYLKNYVIPNKGDGYNSYYNTNKCAALPAGPICNPGLRALKAAAYPVNTNFMYFCNDNADPPNYYYAVTEAEQDANLKKCGY